MATLSSQRAVLTGLTLSFGAAAVGGDDFVNSGRMMLYVKNGGASPVNVTVPSLVTCSQGSTHDVVVAVPNASEKIIGPFPKDRFNNATTGKATITYSGVTSVTIALVEIP
jgi:hypothetical protein